jgi:hypothetical protein
MKKLSFKQRAGATHYPIYNRLRRKRLALANIPFSIRILILIFPKLG